MHISYAYKMTQLDNINTALFAVFIIIAVYIIFKARKRDREEYVAYVEKCKTCDKDVDTKIKHTIHSTINPPGNNTKRILTSTCDGMLKGGMSGCLIGGLPGGIAQGIVTGIVTLVHSGKNVL